MGAGPSPRHVLAVASSNAISTAKASASPAVAAGTSASTAAHRTSAAAEATAAAQASEDSGGGAANLAKAPTAALRTATCQSATHSSRTPAARWAVATSPAAMEVAAATPRISTAATRAPTTPASALSPSRATSTNTSTARGRKAAEPIRGAGVSGLGCAQQRPTQTKRAAEARGSPCRVACTRVWAAAHLAARMWPQSSSPISSASLATASRPSRRTSACQSCAQPVSTETTRMSPFSAAGPNAWMAATLAATTSATELSPSFAKSLRAMIEASRTTECSSAKPATRDATARASPLPSAIGANARTAFNLT
mmetsp:Transcript_53538/g.150417  ORF Transcript_53538/g.150417 Transcript_53538/m.150417 type:complete len:312 (+) Transcript_53538:100-1035(+)